MLLTVDCCLRIKDNAGASERRNENFAKIDKVFQVITTKKIRRLRDAVEERATAFGVVGLRCHDFLGFDER